MAKHQSGEIAGYTCERRPVELKFSQECGTRIEALKAERQIKGWSRGKKEAMIRGDWATVGKMARGKHKHQR